MPHRTWNLTLRDLFWLVLLAAIGIRWGVERNRAATELAKHPRIICLFNSGSMWPNALRTTVLGDLRNATDEEVTNRLRTISSSNLAEAEYTCCLTEMELLSNLVDVS